MSHLVDLRDVTKTYETPAGPFLALRGVDLEVASGEFVAVVGKSGSGKSTLINAIAGIDRPTSGEVHVAGTPVHTLDENEVAAWRGANLGVIFQFFQLLPTLTLLENVALPMEFARLGSARQRRQRALALLERVEMEEHADKLPSAVSGGQQQRVAIARALANDPALIVADEPTGSLDSRTAETVFQLFEDLVDQGKTILMVTHDSDLASRASRVVLIVDGEVVEAHVRSALEGISDDDLADISARLEPIVLDAGETVFAQGDEADRFYIVVRGSLDVVRRRAGGAEERVAVLGPGQYFGEIGLMQGTARNATVRVSAGGEAAVVALDAGAFRHLVADNELAEGAIARVMRQRMTVDTARETLPSKGEARLAGLTDYVQRLALAPGDAITGDGDRFCVVISGGVEALAEGADAVAYRYGPGRHFRTSVAAVIRAAPDAADTEIVAIPEGLRRYLAGTAGVTDDVVALLITDPEGG